MSPAAGWNVSRFGVKGKCGYVQQSTGYDSVSPLLSLVWIRTTVASSLTNASTPIVARRSSPLPGLVPTKRIPSKKDCHVEQKNGNVVRRLVGYDRYNSRSALEALNRIYNLLRLYVNFFQPTMKLVSKTKHGAKVHKVYDTAQTPYQRLVESGVLTEDKRQELATIYHGLNPVLLLKQINSNLEQLWRLAERPAGSGNRNYEATRRASVTV